MKIKSTLPLAAAMAASICCLPVAASNVSYHFDLDTSGLVGNPNAPFALDFQLIDGDSANNTSVVIKNFSSSVAGSLGAPELIGGASGDLASTILISDSDFLNDLFQAFPHGGTISFDVSIASTSSGVTPDSFAVGIGSANDGGIGFFDVFAQIDLGDAQQTPHGTPSLDGVTTSLRVPEAASLANLPLGLGALGIFGFLSQSRKKTATT